MDNFAYLIVTGAPDHTEFGIDLLAINVTKEFRGVKLIPPGAHFVYSSAKDIHLNASTSRNGFIHFFKPGEILVKEYNQANEELQNRTRGDRELEIQRIRENLKDLDRFLAIYEFENYTRWKNLTSLLTENSIARLTPDSGVIRNEIEFKSCPDKDRPRGKPETPIRNVRIRSNDDEAMYLPNLEVITDSQPKFSKLPERYNKFSSPSEKTFNNIDTINLIDKLINEISNKAEVLEELQFSFVIYLCGLSIDSLAHWRQMLSLFCNSEQAVEKHKNYYKELVNVIKHQIPEIPIEFIEQSSSNTIYIDIKNLLRNLNISECSHLANSLQKHLKDTIGWTFDDLMLEDPEDMPQIVNFENC